MASASKNLRKGFFATIVLSSLSCSTEPQGDQNAIKNIDTSHLQGGEVGAFLHKVVFESAPKGPCPKGGVKYNLFIDFNNNEVADDSNSTAYFDCYEVSASDDGQAHFHAKDTSSVASYGENLNAFCQKVLAGKFSDKKLRKILDINNDEDCFNLAEEQVGKKSITLIGPGTLDLRLLKMLAPNLQIAYLNDMNLEGLQSLQNMPSLEMLFLNNILLTPEQIQSLAENSRFEFHFLNFPARARGLYLDALNDLWQRIGNLQPNMQFNPPVSSGPQAGP